MIDYDARRRRFVSLLDNRTQAELAEQLERSPGQVSHLVTGVKNIGERLAEHIERKLGLPRGWLDAGDAGAPDRGQARLSNVHGEVHAKAVELQSRSALASPKTQGLIAKLVQKELDGKLDDDLLGIMDKLLDRLK